MLLAKGSMIEQNYYKAIQLLTQAQDLGPFIQVPELMTISLVRHLLHVQHPADITGRSLVGTSTAFVVQFNSKSVKPCLLPVACVRR